MIIAMIAYHFFRRNAKKPALYVWLGVFAEFASAIVLLLIVTLAMRLPLDAVMAVSTRLTAALQGLILCDFPDELSLLVADLNDSNFVAIGDADSNFLPLGFDFL